MAARREGAGADADEFYLRYYVGHRGKFGHEYVELEVLPDGELRYSNGSRYKSDQDIRKRAVLSPAVIGELRRMVEESGVLGVDDEQWPMPDANGKQELEVVSGDTHISFVTAKINSAAEVAASQDPAGLRTFHTLV
jgi:protein mago nashi